MSDELVTIARFAPGGEAEIASAKLDSEGIAAVIEGEDMAAAFPYAADSSMQIELQVRQCDAERAIAILKDIPAARDNLVAGDES